MKHAGNDFSEAVFFSHSMCSRQSLSLPRILYNTHENHNVHSCQDRQEWLEEWWKVLKSLEGGGGGGGGVEEEEKDEEE